MSHKPIILWLRQDLRLTDNRALEAVLATGAPVLPVYVLDDVAAGGSTPGGRAMGGASRWWLDKSLADLAAAIAKFGGKLILRRGDTRAVLTQLAAETGAVAVHATRAYEPWARRLEDDLHATLADAGVAFRRFGGALLREPEELRTKAGEPFKVYSPLWRALLALGEPRRPSPAPAAITFLAKPPKSDKLSDWALHPKKPDWSAGFGSTWQPGEAGALARLDAFLDRALDDYTEHRNRPDITGTSRLSPHLHFGEISPALCWHRARVAAAGRASAEKGLETFLKEIVWREFSYHLLFHWPDLPQAPFRSEFAHFPWIADGPALQAWQRGLTGYPIVDAGMRELWASGWMHNRVRMIAASFLIKDLMIHWREGERWFWDTLVDADLSSNAASWQWVAGSGADAAPYFRIFNPITQGVKFDPDGAYVRRWVPEIARLPAPLIHEPWTAPALLLHETGIELGRTYPLPIVEHAAARDRALAAFASLKAFKTA
ncbi:MAG: deoxyribodipyrimidine photo-lyase [Hyphomicrobium sp.]